MIKRLLEFQRDKIINEISRLLDSIDDENIMNEIESIIEDRFAILIKELEK